MPHQGQHPHNRPPAALVADRPGLTNPPTPSKASPQDRGVLFLRPGVESTKRMVIGEHLRGQRSRVTSSAKKRLTNMRASTADDAIRLAPPRLLNLEQATRVFIARNDDEMVRGTRNPGGCARKSSRPSRRRAAIRPSRHKWADESRVSPHT